MDWCLNNWLENGGIYFHLINFNFLWLKRSLKFGTFILAFGSAGKLLGISQDFVADGFDSARFCSEATPVITTPLSSAACTSISLFSILISFSAFWRLVCFEVILFFGWSATELTLIILSELCSLDFSDDFVDSKSADLTPSGISSSFFNLIFDSFTTFFVETGSGRSFFDDFVFNFVFLTSSVFPISGFFTSSVVTIFFSTVFRLISGVLLIDRVRTFGVSILGVESASFRSVSGFLLSVEVFDAFS